MLYTVGGFMQTRKLPFMTSIYGMIKGVATTITNNNKSIL